MYNRLLAVLHYTLLIALSIAMVIFGFRLRGLPANTFISYAAFLLILALLQFGRNREGVFLEMFLVVFSWIRYLVIYIAAFLIYNNIKSAEQTEEVSLLAENAPDNLPLFTNEFLIVFSLGLLFCVVSFLYYRRCLRHGPRFTMPHPEAMYFNPFLTWPRLFFFCTGLFLATVIFFASYFHDYTGALSHLDSVLILLTSAFFFGGLFSRKRRFAAAVIIVGAQLLIYISIAQRDALFFSWRSSFDGFFDLWSESKLINLQFHAALLDKAYFVFPEFRGSIMQLAIPAEAPDPIIWKEFILVPLVALYYLANVIFEPALKIVNPKEED